MSRVGEWDSHWEDVSRDIPAEIAWCPRRPDIEVILRFVPDKGRILEAGCGVGIVCGYLSEKTDALIIGIDTSEKALEVAGSVCRGKAVEFLKADITDMPFPDSHFDLVLALGVIEHLESPPDAIREVSRVLTETGIAFISTPNSRCYSHRITRYAKKKLGLWRFGKEESFTEEQLKEMLSCGPLACIESGAFFWGRKPFSRTFETFLNNHFLRYGPMVYVLARGKPRKSGA